MNNQETIETLKELQYQDAKAYIRDNINSASRSFVAIGYYLKYIRNNQLYVEDGYTGVSDFAKAEFGISPGQASKFISINDRFSVDGNSPMLLEQYRDFTSSKLSEMLYLTDEQLDQVSIVTTVSEIREIKEPEKETSFSTSKTESTEPTTIDDLDFTVRTYNCLKRAGIDTIDKLCKLTEDEVIRIRNVSQKCLDEIKLKLTEISRALKPDDIPDTVNDELDIVDNEPEIVNDVDEEVIDEPSFEIVEADIIETEYEDDNDDEYEPGITDPEHYTYRDVDDELDKLMEYVENFREDNSTEPGRRKAKMRLDAIILLDKKMKLSVEDNKSEPEQPELPILKNNDQRKEFIEAYETWLIWIDQELTGERYYRYDFDNGDSIVVKVYYCKIFDYNSANLVYEECFRDDWGKEEYYLLESDKYFKDCETNKSALVDYLKYLQKKGA